MWVSPVVGSVASCLLDSESWARRMPRLDGETRDFWTAMVLLQGKPRKLRLRGPPDYSAGPDLFFSDDNAANGLTRSSSPASGAQLRSIASVPGFTGTTG